MNNSLFDITISRAAPEHVERIAAIAASWRPEGRTDEELSHDGFLVSDFDVDQYKLLVDQSDYAFVATHDGQVVGFLIGYSSDDAYLFGDTIAQQLVTKLDEFVVIKQVAVDREFTQRGIATKLYTHLIKTVRGVRLMASIVDSPSNRASRRFHRRLGFAEAFRLPHPDGRMRTVWRYSTEHASDEVLYAQYEAAVKLYRHEDILNWSKLQNYLYITVATAAAFGFLLVQGESLPNSPRVLPITSLTLALCGIGILTSATFMIALVSGTIYLGVRKEAVCELEDIYVNRNGVRIVSVFLRRTLLRRSPTVWTLRLMPAAGLIGWLTVGIVLILH